MKLGFAQQNYEKLLCQEFNELILASNASSFGWSVQRAAKTVGVTLVAKKFRSNAAMSFGDAV